MPQPSFVSEPNRLEPASTPAGKRMLAMALRKDSGTARGSPAPRRLPGRSRERSGSRQRCRNARKSCAAETKRRRKSAATIEPAKALRRDVVEVGDLGGEPCIVRLPERQPPDRIVHLGGGGLEPGREVGIVGEEGRQFRAERHARGAGQRRHGDDAGSAPPRRQAPAHRRGPAAPPHRCCRSPPSAPCGSAARRPDGRRGRKWRSRRPGSSTRSRSFRPALHDHRGEAEDVGRAAHVLLHQRHAARPA